MDKQKPQLVRITVSNRTIIRVVLMVLILGGIAASLRQAAHALTLIFIAFFLSLALNSPVHWLAQRLPGKKRGSRSLATGIAFFVIVVAIGTFIASIVPPLVKQTGNFVDNLPDKVQSIRDKNNLVGRTIDKYNLSDDLDKFTKDLGSRLNNVSGPVFSTVTRVSGNVFSSLTVLVLTFMMLIEGPRWLAFSKRFIKPDSRDRVQTLAHKMYKIVTGYVNGQLLLASLAAVFILVPLLVLGVDYPIALAVVVFFCGLIPLVGHTIGAIIVSLVALLTSPFAAIAILAYYFLYQQIENYVLQPKIQSSSTDLSPLLVFTSVIIGVSFSGLLGGLVAIPVAGCLRIVVMDFVQRRKLIYDETA